MIKEGSLQAPTRHAIDWQNADFYNQDSLNRELERVFDICHGCRRCVSLCHAFPTLFDLVDESSTMEVDGVDKADYQMVVDHCYLCDLCYMTKCPYVPPHEWNVDFPHLMLRAKAVDFKANGVKTSQVLLSSPQKIGQLLATLKITSLVNKANQIKWIRKLLQNVLSIHTDALLPKFYHKVAVQNVAVGEANKPDKVAIFTTCYGLYNDPESVVDLTQVLRHNGIDVELIKNTECCGMPKLELGDINSVVKYANKNKVALLSLVEAGFKFIAPIPSCVLMFKNELPLLLPNDKDLARIAKAFYDPFEYLQNLHKKGKLNTDFTPLAQKALYHMACHQRVQNIGNQTKNILSLIPKLELKVAARCSGHDGTYGVRKQTHTYAVKIGKPIAKMVNAQDSDVVLSDCAMAGRHIAHISEKNIQAKHPISLLKKAYNLEDKK